MECEQYERIDGWSLAFRVGMGSQFCVESMSIYWFQYVMKRSFDEASANSMQVGEAVGSVTNFIFE